MPVSIPDVQLKLTKVISVYFSIRKILNYEEIFVVSDNYGTFLWVNNSK